MPGSTITLRHVHARGADPAVGFAAVAADDHEALLIEGAPGAVDRFMRSTGTILDVRYGGVGSTAVRIASRGPIIDEWPLAVQVIDDVLRSRWSTTASVERSAAIPPADRVVGAGSTSGSAASEGRDRAAALLTVRGPDGLFEHLVQVEDRGVVRTGPTVGGGHGCSRCRSHRTLRRADVRRCRAVASGARPEDLLVVESRTRDVVTRRWRAWLSKGSALVVEDGDGHSAMG